MTQDELKRLFHYDPDTGVFTNRVARGRAKVGDIAGSHDARGYRRLKVAFKSYQQHRLAFLYMTGEMPDMVDHINRVTDDNRWCNLRPSSAKFTTRQTGRWMPATRAE